MGSWAKESNMAQNNFTATGIQNWATPSNWSLGHVPTSSEDAFIGTTGTIVGSGSNETVLSIGTGTNGDAISPAPRLLLVSMMPLFVKNSPPMPPVPEMSLSSLISVAVDFPPMM